MEETIDIALIGAGPLGIEMAAALKNVGLSYRHFEANQIGATMQWWAPGTRWFSSNERISIAGVPLETPQQEKATREEYLAYLRSVVMQFNLKVSTYTRVTRLRREGDAFLIHTRRNMRGTLSGDETIHRFRKVILSTGGTETPCRLGIPGEELPHVSHYFQDPHSYFGRDLLIVGGRNSAVEAAMRSYRAGAKVHFNYRRSEVDAKDIKYWLYPEFSSLVKAGKIVGHFGAIPVEITPEQVVLQDIGSGKKERVAADFVLLMTGYLADMGLAKAAGIALIGEQDVPQFNPETMETNVPGAYVIGTAVAGTQRRYKVFLENCHVHVDRVIAHLTGKKSHTEERSYDRPES